MREWNVVVTVQGKDFKAALDILSELGEVEPTEYYNVIIMRVEDPARFPAALLETSETFPKLLAFVSRAIPVFARFSFQDAEEFQERAAKTVAPYAVDIAGRSFHVRMHRRGFKGRLKTPEQEQYLTEFLFSQIPEQTGNTTVRFEDPDVILAVETVGNQGGVSIWTRTDMRQYPFLRLD